MRNTNGLVYVVVSCLFWFFRRGPLGLGLGAALILGAGVAFQLKQNDVNARKAAAIASGPPATVEITQFDPARDMNGMREVVLRGQAVLDFGYELTVESDTREHRGFMVPLVASDATDQTAIAGIAFYSSGSFDFDDLTPQFLMNGVVGFGSVGPITEYNGAMRGLGKFEDLVAEAFAEKGLVMPQDVIVVWPYLQGREEALKPAEFAVFSVFSKIAGAIALLALAKLAIHKKEEDRINLEEPPVFDPDEPFFDPDAPVEVAPVESAAPLPPKRRFAAAQGDAPAVTTRKPFGLRKLLIVIVGGLFALGLMATVADVIAKSTPAVAEAPSLQETIASGVAQAIVPEADPDRHWTDIDVTPIAEWFVEKFYLALAGDLDAQIKLGAIVGGLFMGMIGLRMFFALRRAFQPRTTARFDSMGLN